jgi:aminopeptidase N
MTEHRRCGFCVTELIAEAERERGGAAAGRPFSLATSTRHYEPDRPFALTHLALDWVIQPEARKLSGSCELSLVRVNEEAELLELDAVAFDVESVTIDTEKAPFSYDGRIISVTIPRSAKTLKVCVRYAVEPRRGMYFIEPDEHYPNKPRQVWTQCQEEDARYFIPCHDKPHVKMTSSLRVSVPEAWSVLSNGELIRSTKNEGRAHFHWEMRERYASYLFTLVAGEFATSEDDSAHPPLSYYVPKGKEDDARETFKNTRKMVAFFEKTFGAKFPWNKYAQAVVSDFIFGGMENTSATTLYEHVILDSTARLDATSEDLIAHELAHQWFGDYVTCRDWSEGWLNEGFATYSEHLWREHNEGLDEFEYGLLTDLDAYLGEARGRYRRPIVCQDYDAPLDLFDRHLYEKGSLFLHTLRMHLGHERFALQVAAYLHRHAHGVVETRDFMRAMEEGTGRSLARMFDEGLYKPGHVELDVDIQWNSGLLKLTVKQTQATTDGVPSAFSVPLEIRVCTAKGVGTRVLTVDKRTETFVLPLAERPKYVAVDPRLRILGDVKVKAPNDMLRAQLKDGTSARMRWTAAQALAGTDEAPTIRSLAERLADPKEFWGVRAECAVALSKNQSKASRAALIEALTCDHPKVRRAAARALGKFVESDVVDALAKATGDVSYFVRGDAARALGKTRSEKAQPVLERLLSEPSWADVVESAAVDGLAALRSESTLVRLEEQTALGKPTRVRRAAILALPKVRADKRTRELLERFLSDSDPHLRIDVARALLELADTHVRPALSARLEVDLDPRVRRRIREVLRDLGGDGKKAHADLREELEKLRSELARTNARVTELDGAIKHAKPPAKVNAAAKKEAAKKSLLGEPR